MKKHKETIFLNKAESKYRNAIDEIEKQLIDKIKFKFSIVHQPFDGFCILAYDRDFLAPIDDCLNAINNKGILTYEDFINIVFEKL